MGRGSSRDSQDFPLGAVAVRPSTPNWSYHEQKVLPRALESRLAPVSPLPRATFPAAAMAPRGKGRSQQGPGSNEGGVMELLNKINNQMGDLRAHQKKTDLEVAKLRGERGSTATPAAHAASSASVGEAGSSVFISAASRPKPISSSMPFISTSPDAEPLASVSVRGDFSRR